MWMMRHHGSIPQEERLSFVLCGIHELVDRQQGFAPNLEPLIAVPPAFDFVAGGHAVSETASLEVALPPFAGLKADGTGLAEQPGQRRLFVHEAIHALAPAEEFRRLVAGRAL